MSKHYVLDSDLVLYIPDQAVTTLETLRYFDPVSWNPLVPR